MYPNTRPICTHRHNSREIRFAGLLRDAAGKEIQITEKEKDQHWEFIFNLPAVVHVRRRPMPHLSVLCEGPMSSSNFSISSRQSTQIWKRENSPENEDVKQRSAKQICLILIDFVKLLPLARCFDLFRLPFLNTPTENTCLRRLRSSDPYTERIFKYSFAYLFACLKYLNQ